MTRRADAAPAPEYISACLVRWARMAAVGLTAVVLTACGGGGGGSDGGGSNPPGDTVTISGKVTYERVPFSTDPTQGLDYAATVELPVRDVPVEVISSSNQSVLASTTTNASGQYSVTAPSNTSVFVRAKAQTSRPAPGWNVQVLNNVNSNALYVLDSATFRTDSATVTKNLVAGSGWPDFGGTNYTSTRASAPFAILDSIYTALDFVRANGGSELDLPPLKVFWSKDNRTSTTWNPAIGSILSGTQYTNGSIDGFPSGMYVLGDEDTDTDEFDDHVIVHEFQHFLEDTISRTDSPGGGHSLDERLDMRLAFTEGYANAFSGMALGDPLYRDSYGSRQGRSFTINLESNANSPAGFFNEGSVGTLVWDLFDAASDGQDQVALGYAPMLEVLRNDVRSGVPLVSIYSFVAAVRSGVSGSVATAIDSLLASQRVFGSGPWGAGETNFDTVSEASPVYTPVTAGGGPVRVCGTTEAGTYNKLGNRLFLRFSLASTRQVTIRAEYTASGSTLGGPDPDPDIVLYHGGFLDVAETSTINVETLTRSLEAGEYVIEVYEYSHVDPSPDASRRGVTCMDVSVS